MTSQGTPLLDLSFRSNDSHFRSWGDTSGLITKVEPRGDLLYERTLLASVDGINLMTQFIWATDRGSSISCMCRVSSIPIALGVWSGVTPHSTIQIKYFVRGGYLQYTSLLPEL